MEGFRLAKSISTLKPYRACLLPAKEETEGSNPPNWKRLRWKPGKASQKKNAKVWWCQWVTGLMQLLKAKDLQLNIKLFFFTLMYVNSICSNTFAHVKNRWVQTKGASSKLFIRYRYEYLEIKAEMLISHLIFIFWCQTQMFSVYSKNKGIGLTVPILLEGSVYVKLMGEGTFSKFPVQNITSSLFVCLFVLCDICCIHSCIFFTVN